MNIQEAAAIWAINQARKRLKRQGVHNMQQWTANELGEQLYAIQHEVR